MDNQKSSSNRNERVKLDQIIKLLFNVSKKTLVNTLNGLFNENYNPDDVDVRVSKTANEFVKDNLNVIIADTFLKLELVNETRPYHYHIEYQLNSDDRIILRVFEYSIMKTLENSRTESDNKGKVVLYMPKSIVIHFTASRSIPDKYELEIIFPHGSVQEYSVDVMKYWNYDNKMLIEKKLYNLLPLQLFLLRAELDKIAVDNIQARQEAISKARNMAEDIIDTITLLYEKNEFNFYDYDKLINGLSQIIHHLDTRYKFNRKLSGGIKTMVKSLIDPKVTEQAKIDVAKEMILNNEPIEKIIKYTKLTEKKINDIQKTLNNKTV